MLRAVLAREASSALEGGRLFSSAWGTRGDVRWVGRRGIGDFRGKEGGGMYLAFFSDAALGVDFFFFGLGRLCYGHGHVVVFLIVGFGHCAAWGGGRRG